MSTENLKQVSLAFGYNQGIPEDCEAAWGCRAIVNQDGHVDVVYDRQDADGVQAQKDELLGHLNDHVKGQWVDQARALLKDYTMNTRKAQEFVLYEDEKCLIKGNTNGSAGYLYVCAYLYRKP